MSIIESVLLASHCNSILNSLSYRFDRTVVDPGDVEVRDVVDFVLLTHCHFDHIFGLNALWINNHNIKVYTNDIGCHMLFDAKKNLSKYHGQLFEFEHPENVFIVGDGDIVELDGGKAATAVFTPGHNASCITWMVSDWLFTGDAYIPGIGVVTNLPGGDKSQAEISVCRIMDLAQGRTICPGHDVLT